MAHRLRLRRPREFTRYVRPRIGEGQSQRIRQPLPLVPPDGQTTSEEPTAGNTRG